MKRSEAMSMFYDYFKGMPIRDMTTEVIFDFMEKVIRMKPPQTVVRASYWDHETKERCFHDQIAYEWDEEE